MKRKKTTDALEILYHDFFEGRPDRIAELDIVRQSAAIARELWNMRSEAGLTQRELAKRVGTSPSVISRLENDDYEGHSLNILRRVAAALGKNVVVRFVDQAENTAKSEYTRYIG